MTLFAQELIFGVVGGLGLFLFGLTLMGQGFQKIAGDKLRRFLETTENPLLAAVTGLLLTTVLQDGAAAVALVVGLLSSGLLRLKQALCMLLGVNLGISITVHLIAFRIEHYPLLAVGLGFLLYSFGRKRFTRYLGYSILGFGLVFTGLDTLLETMKPVAGSILVQGTISRFGRLPVWGYITGALATFVVQSSAATIGLLQIVASQSVQENGLLLTLLPAALPFLFGANLGVCATATLASYKGNVMTKRVVLAQWIINLLPSFLFLLLVKPFSYLIQELTQGLCALGSWIGEVFFHIPFECLPQRAVISREIAVAHTVYNLLMLLFWLPFLTPLLKMTERVFPNGRMEEDMQPSFLNEKMFDTPAVALQLATKEILRMADLALEMLHLAWTAFTQGNVAAIREVERKEKMADGFQERITIYLSTLLSRSLLTAAQSQYLAGLIHVVNDVERMADHAENIAQCAEAKIDEKLPFSETAMNELDLLYHKVIAICKEAFCALADNDQAVAWRVLEKEEAADKLEEEMKQNHINRLNRGRCWPASGIVYLEFIANLERVADHAVNIAQVVLKGKERGI
ncbi:MAG: Na/Pi cotransporter family protein [Firmicutes bacterium]|nr:Na/Pi cotransporter family protein [Bacillota bacterium]